MVAPLPFEPVLPTPSGAAVSASTTVRLAAVTDAHTPHRAIKRPHRWHSDELLGGALEAEIQHGQALYRLRLTSLGKLILVK